LRGKLSGLCGFLCRVRIFVRYQEGIHHGLGLSLSHINEPNSGSVKPEGEDRNCDSGENKKKLFVCNDNGFYVRSDIGKDDGNRRIESLILIVGFVFLMYKAISREIRDSDEIRAIYDGKKQDAEQRNAEPARHD
jgi:hypothetical protein